MAIGLISSPAAWYNGTVAPNSWFQSVQDTVNASYKAGASSYNYWLHASSLTPTVSTWTLVSGAYQASGATQFLRVAIPLIYIDATHYQRISSVTVRCNQASAAGITVNLVDYTAITTLAAPTENVVSTVTGPASTGEKSIVLTPTLTAPTSSVLIFLRIDSAANNDKVYGINVVIDNSQMYVP
jgi:hypothetical protein